MTDLKSVKWKAFYINDIFSISAGKRLTKAVMDSGQIPFIGATDSNNGITNWIATPNSSFDKNVLGVNYNGSVVENFYHPYCCVFSDDVKRLHLRKCADNKYILLFFKTVILQQKIKYTYGYKFNGQRMERQKIYFPSMRKTTRITSSWNSTGNKSCCKNTNNILTIYVHKHGKGRKRRQG